MIQDKVIGEPLSKKLIADLSPISELFNLAYAQHEITDEYLNETIEFF